MNESDLNMLLKSCENDIRLQQIISYVHLHYHEKITLADISTTIHIAPQSLCRFFKTMTTMRLMSYINYYRVTKARELLKETQLNIIDIAFMCGFENVSYFNRVFKQYFHCTPSSIRHTTNELISQKAEIR